MSKYIICIFTNEVLHVICYHIPTDNKADDIKRPDDLYGLSDLDDESMTQKSVTQTADNVQFVTSFVLSLTARTSPRYRSISQ